ncbi:uncharacterized protein LOC142220279 [Haematobia irritans]|uniref:uncharacterized protein LOC142220279 n=1 Tax=Haematobia irritans TaxID=7368 RepID=UPI003F509CBE
MDEMLYSATYVDNYIDSVENLPDDIQRHLSRIHDIDVQYRSLLRDVDHYYDLWRTLQNGGESNTIRRARSVTRMQQSLIQAQELGDEKMQIVTQLQELIDLKTRQLDTDQKNLDIKEEKDDIMQMALEECGAPTPQKQTRTQSPSRAGEVSAIAGAIANGYGLPNTASLNSMGGGNSTPNSERSGSGTVGSTSNNSNGNNGGLMNSSNSENQRSNSKRSRRRNDTAGNMELGGNESNSANEGGSNGNDRNIGQKASNMAASQKKNATVQNLAGTSVVTASAIIGSGSASGNGGGGGGASSGSGNNHSGKKKKRKARGGAQSSAQANAREETPPPDPIDPDEPTYCVCNQISFGEMILCDNDLCPIEWFHFSCVALVSKPKGKWYCPNCRGDRQNLMKPKAQFLKELERYNKEKEEKT